MEKRENKLLGIFTSIASAWERSDECGKMEPRELLAVRAVQSRLSTLSGSQ